MPIVLNGNGTVTGLSQLPDSAMAAGSILQVKQTFKTDFFSTTSSSFVDITGMSLEITPTSTSSKILIEVIINAGGESNFYGGIKLLRGSTTIGLSTAVSLGNQVNAFFGSFVANGANGNVKTGTFGQKFLDLPSTTSATTYKLQVYCRNSKEFNLNRNNSNANGAETVGSTSSITAMEVAAWVD